MYGLLFFCNFLYFFVKKFAEKKKSINLALSNSSKKINMLFTLEIWYRYTTNGDQQKDFDRFEIEAINIHTAFKFIKKLKFDGFNAIPFKYGLVIDNKVVQWYDAFSFDVKDQAFEEPISKLLRVY